jgi:hypothetical protein
VNRFRDGRWYRILVWTGAAMAWGSALVAFRLEPARSTGVTPAPEEVQMILDEQAVMPRPPASGLVVIRYTPVAAPDPVVRTVMVPRPAASTPSSASTPAKSAPQPSSSGS